MYPPRLRRISLDTVALSRGKPLRDRHIASMLVLMHDCINTAARRLTLLGPYPTLKLHAPNAAASAAEAASCVTRTQASRLVWRHARPARSAN